MSRASFQTDGLRRRCAHTRASEEQAEDEILAEDELGLNLETVMNVLTTRAESS